MKFAQEFKRSLQREGFPQEWTDSAIPYGQLKKCLKKVTKELQGLGLDKKTLDKLATSEPESVTDLGFQYDLEGDRGQPKHIRPRLTVLVHLHDGVAIDAQLSPETRAFLRHLAGPDTTTPPRISTSSAHPLRSDNDPSPTQSAVALVQRVEVPLIFDGEFFDLLQNDVSALDNLQKKEERRLVEEIKTLGQSIELMTRPSSLKSRKAKADVEKWREIFGLYLDARIFFSTRESDHGARTSAQALDQLQWFQNEVLKRNLPQTLKLTASRDALSKFLEVNGLVLQSLKFQEINQLAVSKIMKKFDKRTALGATKAFPAAMQSNRLLAGSMAKDLCAQVSAEIVSVVPQLDDYLCPVCLTIAYWPIRLECDHVFCTRCMVKMQRKAEQFCPLCRKSVILKASSDNLDTDYSDFLRQHFPKEVKEKMKASEIERLKEIHGEEFVDMRCLVM